MKTIWISALSKNQPRVSAVSAVLKRYGLDAKGHFWIDETEKVSSRVALDGLLEARADVWLILADNAEMAKPTVRYGLSLLAAGLRAARGAGFPIVMLWDAAPTVELPGLLQPVTTALEAESSWPAKIVAKANVPPKVAAPDYCFDVVGDERMGQWFAIGPRGEGKVWDGVMFGVAGEGAEINFQAVGPSGALPEKTVLEFAQQGMTLQVGEREFTAWAVRNPVDAASSYYARVKGCPEAVLFMPYAEGADAEATVLRLS